MAVFVDQLSSTVPSRRWPYTAGCHMFADTDAQLHGMAAAIGLRREWFQDSAHPHYDLTATKRNHATDLGACTTTTREWIQRTKPTN